jgi:uncharacterized protein (TIGR00255 family)
MHLEVKTVNHRHFNPQLKLPSVLGEHEAAIRDYLRRRVDRGHVTASARWLEEAQRATSIEINPERAAEYWKAYTELGKHLGIEDQVGLEHIARQPEVMTTKAADLEPIVWEEIEPVLAMACDGLDTMRSREGDVLGKELSGRVEAIRTLLAKVMEQAPERLIKEKTRLQEAVRELSDGQNINEDRLAQEIAILADKLDVTEETVRLDAHLNAAIAALGSGQAIGKELGFLGQEILREINTIGSKANDADIAHAVIGMKGELEKYREQVENIE